MTVEQRFRLGMAAARGEPRPADIPEEADHRSPEDIERERDAYDRKRAGGMERLAGVRGDQRLHARAGALRNHVQARADARRQRDAMARVLPAGQVPAILVGPARVGPCARGQLSSGRPQGGHSAAACARGPDEPSEPEPGEGVRRGYEDEDDGPEVEPSSRDDLEQRRSCEGERGGAA